jgi:hypothetical protein
MAVPVVCRPDEPNKLVHIIVTNNAIVITFSPHKLAATNDLIALTTNEAIKWLDSHTEVESFLGRNRCGSGNRESGSIVVVPDVVHMKSAECLVEGHSRRTAVKQVHQKIELRSCE